MTLFSEFIQQWTYKAYFAWKEAERNSVFLVVFLSLRSLGCVYADSSSQSMWIVAYYHDIVPSSQVPSVMCLNTTDVWAHL